MLSSDLSLCLLMAGEKLEIKSSHGTFNRFILSQKLALNHISAILRAQTFLFLFMQMKRWQFAVTMKWNWQRIVRWFIVTASLPPIYAVGGDFMTSAEHNKRIVQPQKGIYWEITGTGDAKGQRFLFINLRDLRKENKTARKHPSSPRRSDHHSFLTTTLSNSYFITHSSSARNKPLTPSLQAAWCWRPLKKTLKRPTNEKNTRKVATKENERAITIKWETEDKSCLAGIERKIVFGNLCLMSFRST